jgi:hypothetical protein
MSHLPETKLMPTTEQLLRLPKWAQEQIRDLTRQRDTAVRKLFEFEDNQTPSKVWSEDMLHVGSRPTLVRHYFQANDVEIEHAGVHLMVRGLHDDKSPMHLSWRPAGEGGWSYADVALIPESYQQVRLVAMEKRKR